MTPTSQEGVLKLWPAECLWDDWESSTQKPSLSLTSRYHVQQWKLTQSLSCKYKQTLSLTYCFSHDVFTYKIPQGIAGSVDESNDFQLRIFFWLRQYIVIGCCFYFPFTQNNMHVLVSRISITCVNEGQLDTSATINIMIFNSSNTTSYERLICCACQVKSTQNC